LALTTRPIVGSDRHRAIRKEGRLPPVGEMDELRAEYRIPLDAFDAGLGDHKIVTTLRPGGKQRMRCLVEVIASGRVDLTSLVTHRYKLDDIEHAYDLFSHQRDGVLRSRSLPNVGHAAHVRGGMRYPCRMWM
jgi:threonine dehydrogenase-like Zn-dependent dehydrogenase